MNYKQKYNKYIKKILRLNQVGGRRRVTVIPNSGAMEGMTNQCMWISILDYLHMHGYPELTLRVLRENGELDNTTEHTMFDSIVPIFMQALRRIAEIYNLQIIIHTVNHRGYLVHEHTTIINKGVLNIVNIAQYGLYHFQLITGIIDVELVQEDQAFRPAVQVNAALVFADTLPSNKKEAMLELSEKQLEHREMNGHLEILTTTLTENKKSYEQLLKTYKENKDSTELQPDIKKLLVSRLELDMNNMQRQIQLQGEEIEKLKTQIPKLRDRINQLGLKALLDE